MEKSASEEDGAAGGKKGGAAAATPQQAVSSSGPQSQQARKTRKQQAQGETGGNKDRKTGEDNNPARSGSEGVALPMSLIKALRGKSSGENGSSSSNGGGSGNNSDNSALISLGNTSFGFNFDSEEAMMNGSPQNSEGGDSDGNGNNNSAAFQGNLLKQAAVRARQARAQQVQAQAQQAQAQQAQAQQAQAQQAQAQQAQAQQAQAQAQVQQQAQPQAVSSSKASTGPTAGQASATILPSSIASSHNAAAAAAVANLQSIAAQYTNKYQQSVGNKYQNAPKRKSQESVDNDSGGYNTDEDSRGDGSKRPSSPGMDDSVMSGESDRKGGRKKKKLDDFKREERNAREKERSFRISRQINELRSLLSSGGVIVPKGTKSSVLTEAANYIRMLQQHQYRSEIDRHQLVQQIQMIGGGALGQPAATAVRHVAAQNGVWSLGNFGGVPPKSAMMYNQPGGVSVTVPGDATDATSQQPGAQDPSVLPNKIEAHDYRFVFNSSAVGMAIASMGGAFIDCNKLFSQLSNLTKQEVCSMTIFNLTARQDLQHAFDLISQMLSAPTAGADTTTTCVLRGSLQNRSDLGLNVALIKGDDGVAKCFCVTLVMNPSSPFDTSRPTPATIDCVQQPQQPVVAPKTAAASGLDSTPAYTTG